MDIATINQIREIRDEIRKSLGNIKASDYAGQKFGPESEYSVKGLLAGVEGTLIDVSALTKAPSKFIKASTHAERTTLIRQLQTLSAHASNKDMSSIAASIDSIKPLVRGWGVRHTSERMEAFEEHINECQRKAQSLSESVSELTAIQEQANALKGEIEAKYKELTTKAEQLAEQEQALEESIAATTAKREELDNLLNTDEERSNEIEELLTKARGHSEIIDGFSKRVSNRETQLENQEVATSGYKKRLKEMEEEREALLKEASELIESAKRALEYKTAEGLSAAFAAQYRVASRHRSTLGWIAAAAAFLGGALWIGIWTVADQQLRLESVIGRLSLIPILIGGAWFCAGQYVKQKNIAEDYAYKSTLAKSIVGFSDQLSSDSEKGEDYSHFIKSVLAQIHIDPLGRNGNGNNERGDLDSDLKRVLEEVKGLKSVVEMLQKAGVSRTRTPG